MRRISLLSIVLHLAGWILFLSLPLLFIGGQSSSGLAWSILFSADAVLFCASFLFIFYLHTYYLFSYLYLEKKIIAYVLSLLIIFAGIWMLRPFDRLMAKSTPMQENMQHKPPRDDHQRRAEFRPPPGDFGERRPPRESREFSRRHIDMVSIFLLVMILAFSAALQFRQLTREAEQKTFEAIADKTRAELYFLKSQIQPHFLFNTLNNIYSLATRGEPNTAEAILKLSNILRYTTDEASRNFVPLGDEINFLHDYVDLQRLRLGDKMNIDLSVSGSTSGRQIAPLLLMTFVENAFKYGVSNSQPSVITIRLEALDKKIYFRCENALFSTPRNAERTGIGISNTRKRLEQLYAGTYSLSIVSGSEKYTVELTLPDQPPI